MTDCPHCGRPNQPNARFCRGCGQPVAEERVEDVPQPARCESCGAEVVLHALFCHRCGQALASEAPTTMISPSARPVTRSTPADARSVVPSPPDPAPSFPPEPSSTSSAAHASASSATTAPTAPRDEGLTQLTDPCPSPKVADGADPSLPADASTIVPQPAVHSEDSSGAFSRSSTAPALGDAAALDSRSASPGPDRARAARSPAPPNTTRGCSACGATVARDARFCRSCGAALNAPSQQASSQATTCARCGKEVESWARFCRHCGMSRTAEGSGSDSEAPGTCVVCGAPAEVPGGMCSGCAEAVPAGRPRIQ